MNEVIIMNAVEIKDLYKSYEKGKIKALNGINLTIKEGEFVSIIGPSGSGKSTLLNMLGALDIPDSGVINVAGKDLKSDKKLNKFRAEQIGFIFQLHNLIPNITVRENIEIPMYTQKLSSSKMKERALKLLEDVGLYDKADIALDCMGRHRVGVYYNSSLKGKEYCAYGVPIISGVETELDQRKEFQYYLRVPADDTILDMDDIVNYYHKCYDGTSPSELADIRAMMK